MPAFILFLFLRRLSELVRPPTGANDDAQLSDGMASKVSGCGWLSIACTGTLIGSTAWLGGTETWLNAFQVLK